MSKKVIATYFTILFMAMVTAPIIVVAFDCDIDTSIFYSLGEEEENGEIKDVKMFLSLELGNNGLTLDSKEIQFVAYNHKSYLNPYLNLASPPPKASLS